MRPDIRRFLGLGFGLALAMLIANALLSAWNIHRLVENNDRVVRASRALARLEKTLTLVVDAETGQRSYFLTAGDESYLEPFHKSVDALNSQLDRLEESFDDPDQRRKIVDLKARVEWKIGELRKTITLFKDKHDPRAALAVVTSGSGKLAMDQIRRVIEDMELTERSFVEQRTAESSRGLQWAIATAAFATISALIVIAFLAKQMFGHLMMQKSYEQMLKDQAERWRVTLSSIGDGVIVTDIAGRVIFMNRVAEQLTGVDHGVALSQPIPQVFQIINEESRLPVANPVAKVLEEGMTVGLANHSLLIHADGTERPIHDSAAPIRDQTGAIRGVVLVFRDDTERRDIERQLVETNRRKDEFLAMLAHELRNPLASIRAAVQIFEIPTAADHDLAVQVIGQRVNHLTALLDDLLDVSRITRGKIRLRKEIVDARTIVNRSIDSVRHLLEERNQKLEVALGDQPLMLDADPVRLEQILVNLLANATKYTPENGSVRVSAELLEQQVIIRVIDDGSGIHPDSMRTIFDVFSQGERTLARSEGGLGVGLAIVKNLVELHGGSVSAKSEGVGKGSELIVRLPSEVPPAVVPETIPADPPVAKLGRRILIVEDNESLARLLARLLVALGHEVRAVHDGLDCIQIARTDKPDVILLDIGLPTIDGYQVARRLRVDEGMTQTLIIAISGYGQDDDRRRSREAGIDHHLTKPVDVDVINNLIVQKSY